jgi:hypothetical protein
MKQFPCMEPSVLFNRLIPHSRAKELEGRP